MQMLRKLSKNNEFKKVNKDAELSLHLIMLKRYTVKRNITVRAFTVDVLHLLDALAKRKDTELVVGSAFYDRYFKE